MPFLDHFGLSDYPFGLTPNPSLYYPSQETEAVLSALCFATSRGDGLLKVTGEVGTGKTLLCRLFMAKLADMPVNIAYLNAPAPLLSGQIPAVVAKEFGIKLGRKEPVAALRDFLIKEHAKGKRNILIVDEAQALGRDGLEAIRLLSNLETNTDKLLQIVLFGQPELDELLQQQDLRQVLQRVSFSFSTNPMEESRVSSYLRFRVEECGRVVKKGRAKKKVQPNVIFTSRATRMIARTSGGLPRLIHTLADKALIAAYAKGSVVVDVCHVRAACRDTQGLVFPWGVLARIGL